MVSVSGTVEPFSQVGCGLHLLHGLAVGYRALGRGGELARLFCISGLANLLASDRTAHPSLPQGLSRHLSHGRLTWTVWDCEVITVVRTAE